MLYALKLAIKSIIVELFDLAIVIQLPLDSLSVQLKLNNANKVKYYALSAKVEGMQTAHLQFQMGTQFMKMKNGTEKLI